MQLRYPDIHVNHTAVPLNGLSLDSLALPVHGAGGRRPAAGMHLLRRGEAEPGRRDADRASREKNPLSSSIAFHTTSGHVMIVPYGARGRNFNCANRGRWAK